MIFVFLFVKYFSKSFGDGVPWQNQIYGYQIIVFFFRYDFNPYT